MRAKPFHFPSATGVCEISAEAYFPEDGQFDTVLVIHHGMAEHRKRYLSFIEFLCGHGIAVYMHDMANHGSSNSDLALAGWFGKQDGWKGLIQDFREMVRRAREENPGKRIFVMGHSMGSFLCRMYLTEYPEDHPDGAIIMGTGGPNPAAGAGIAAASLISLLRGRTHKSKLLDKMAFGTYGKRFEGRTAFDWLTRDREIVDRYIADPYCGFLFTVQGMKDLVTVNSLSNAEEWFRKVPRALPLLLISGAKDPVGNYGEGVKTVAEKLKAAGHQKVKVILYAEDRHEVLNELNRAEVMEDLVNWIRKTESAVPEK